MQFTVNREELLKPLQQVCSVLNARPQMNVLNNLLLEIKEGVLFLTGTDLEVELTTQAKLLEGSAAARTTIPAKKFLDICKNLAEGSEISVQFEGERALVRSGRVKFTLATIDAEEYPALLDWQPEVDFNLEQAVLARLIDTTQFSMANQDARYFLNGMKLETEGNLLRSVATDGHRLAVCTIPLEYELPSHSVIVPRKAVLELSRLLMASTEQARLEIGVNNIRATMTGIVFSSKLIDGRFPDYRRVLPRNADRILEVDAEVLKRALVRSAILSNERFKGVRLSLSKDQLKITATNPAQEEAEELLDVYYDNVEMEVGFNVGYLLDVLNALRNSRVRLNMVDGNSSCLIEDCQDSTAEYVIMPMRL